VWNLFKTLRERDSARLRQLEKDFELLASDVETCMATIPKIHAKLRMRATRAAQAEIEGEEVFQPSVESPASPSSPAPVYSKAQLREFARQRGIILSPQRQQGAT
jgi:hypothetical protein